MPAREPAGSTDDRLTRIEADLATLLRGQADLQENAKVLNGTIADILTEIGGVPGSIGRNPQRESIRVRLHHLEDTKHAAIAVNAALGLIFGRTTKVLIVTGAVVSGAVGILRFFGLGG